MGRERERERVAAVPENRIEWLAELAMEKKEKPM